MIYALWHGGDSYAHGDARDVEQFPSIKAAREAMDDRYRNGYTFRQDFNFVTREPESVLCPVVENDSMDLWLVNPVSVDDTGRVEWAGDYPCDLRLSRGPRGGIVRENN